LCGGIGGTINIYDNRTCPAYTGDYTITSQSGLDSLSGYSEVTGNLTINDFTASIVSLNGLEGLSSVGGTLRIRNNEALTSLSGIGNVYSVGGDLVIENNTALIGLDLVSLCSIGYNFLINANTRLCENLAEDLRDQIQTCPDGGIGGGTIEITGNRKCR